MVPDSKGRGSIDNRQQGRFSQHTNRRRFLTLTGLGIAGLSGTANAERAGAILGQESGAASVHFTLSWIPKGQVSPVFVAQDKGFWAEKGLSVQISRGYGSAETAKAVGNGNSDVGFAGVAAVMGAINEGLPLIETAPLLHSHPTAAYSLDEELNEPEDLVGLSGAVDPGGENGAVMEAFLESQGISWDSIDWLETGGAGFDQIVSGQTDFALDWVTNAGEFWYADEPREPSMLQLSNYVDIYGNGLITRPQFLEENEETVRRFVEGVYEGYQYVFENGEEGVQESVDLLFQFFPELALGEGSEDFHLSNLRLFLSLLMTEDTQENGLSSWDQEKAQNTLDVVNSLYEEDIPFESAFHTDPQLIPDGEYMIPNYDENRERLQVIQPGDHPNPVFEDSETELDATGNATNATGNGMNVTENATNATGNETGDS